jgi:hypothetical protein
MKFPTIKKFLFVFDLNLGGLVLGYFGAISNATLALLLIIDLILYGDKFEDEAEKIAKNTEDLSPDLEMIDKVVHPTLTAMSVKHLSPKGFFQNDIIDLFSFTWIYL